MSGRSVPCTHPNKDGTACRQFAMKGLDRPVCYRHAVVLGLVPQPRQGDQKTRDFAPSGKTRRTRDKRPARPCKCTRQDGSPCPKFAMAGQLVCSQHGGMGARSRAKGARVIAEDKARAVLARLGVPPVENALEELQKVAGQVIAWKDACAEMVNRLREEEIRYEGKLAGELLRAEVLLWERSLDRSIQVLNALARCQVEERLTMIRERDAERIAGAWAAAMRLSGLDAEGQARARRAFNYHLRIIPGEKAS